MTSMAVIIAGGKAVRLHPLTVDLPKSLIEVNGKPFIYHQLVMLKEQGIKNVVICAGFKGLMIEEYVNSVNGLGLNTKFSYDGETALGTGGALRKAFGLLDTSFYVLYGDSYLTIDLKAANAYYDKCGKDLLMVIIRNNNRWDKSNVVFSGGKVVQYNKNTYNSQMQYIDYGISLMNKTSVLEIPENTTCDLGELYTELAERGRLAGFEVHDRFYEIGSFSGIKETAQFLSQKYHRER